MADRIGFMAQNRVGNIKRVKEEVEKEIISEIDLKEFVTKLKGKFPAHTERTLIDYLYTLESQGIIKIDAGLNRIFRQVTEEEYPRELLNELDSNSQLEDNENEEDESEEDDTQQN